MTLTKSPYICNPDILFCHEARATRPVALDFGDADMLPAGTLISCEGKAVNDLTALGVLLYDTWKGYGSDKGVVLISGHVDLAKAQENCGQTYSSEAKAALKGIVFVGDTCCSVVVGESTVMGDTLTWDGNTEGLESASVFGGSVILYHVTDITPTRAEYTNGFTLKLSDGTEEEIPAEMIPEISTEDGFLYGGKFAIVPTDNYAWDAGGGNIAGTFSKKGVYIASAEGLYISSLTINGYTEFVSTEITPIDPKYLPVDYIKQLIAEVTGK